MKKSIHISFWVFIALAVILVVFSVLNSGEIPVDIIFKKVEISLAILLAVTFFSGMVAGALYAFMKVSRKEKQQETEYIVMEPKTKKNDSTPYDEE